MIDDSISIGTHVAKIFKQLVDAQKCHDCGAFVPEGLGHYPNPERYIRVCSKCLPKYVPTSVGSD